MKIAIIVFPGSNCDHDSFNVFKNILDIPVEFVWHKETDLKNFDGMIIPGGFSYGDYLRSGAIAKFSPIMHSIIQASKVGKPIIGICNGFQILIEANLLPGSLIINSGVKFLSKSIKLQVVTNDSIFTKLYDKGQHLQMPIAHKQGNYIADEKTIKDLEDNNCIIFKYIDGNPNGSINGIAGLINKNRNILGMMPHPERAAENILGSKDGLNLFKSMIESIL